MTSSQILNPTTANHSFWKESWKQGEIIPANVMRSIQRNGDVSLMSAVLWTVLTNNKIVAATGFEPASELQLFYDNKADITAPTIYAITHQP